MTVLALIAERLAEICADLDPAAGPANERLVESGELGDAVDDPRQRLRI